MDINITDADLAPRTNKWFDVGQYEVKITGIGRTEMADGRPYIAVDLEGEEGQETDVRMWLHTEKGSKYTLSVLNGIAVHNKKTDGDKDKVRSAFKAITNTDMVDDKFLARFKGMEAFINVYEGDTANPNGGFYKRTDLSAYMPAPKKQTAEQIMGAPKTDISPSDIPF